MAAVVTLINALLTKAFDILLWPFGHMAPLWPLLFVSLVTGVIILWIFGKISNQDAIRVIRNRIRGNLLGIRLFQDETGVLLRLQGAIFVDSMRYFGHSLAPMVVLLLPVVLVMIQLNLRFEDRPLAVGESAVVKVHVNDIAALRQPASVEAPAGLTVETPPVCIPTEHEVAWRLRADQPGEYSIKVHIGSDTIEKTISAGQGWQSVSSYRTNSLWESLLYPGERLLEPAHASDSVTVNYPNLNIDVFGFTIHWLIIFFVCSILFSFAFKDILGVEI